MTLLPPQPPEARACSLAEKLQILTDGLPASGGVTVAEIRDLIGQDGLLLLVTFLALVFLIPVSIPGVSTVFGGVILLIGVCRLRNRSLWLPRRLVQRRLPADRLQKVLRRGSRWLQRLERVSRPQRWRWLTASGLPDIVNNGALIVGAVLLMAPFGLVPFSNTLPALALMFLAIGLLQRDGLFVLYGHLVNLVTIIYFAALMAGGGVAIREAFRRLVGQSS